MRHLQNPPACGARSIAPHEMPANHAEQCSELRSNRAFCRGLIISKQEHPQTRREFKGVFQFYNTLGTKEIARCFRRRGALEPGRNLTPSPSPPGTIVARASSPAGSGGVPPRERGFDFRSSQRDAAETRRRDGCATAVVSAKLCDFVPLLFNPCSSVSIRGWCLMWLKVEG